MLSATQSYKDSVYGQSRLIKGRVTFDISDVSAASDVSSLTGSTQFANSNISQLNDNVRDISYLQSTWEENRTKLDGSFSFADSTIANNGQVGYVTNAICNENGSFDTAQSVTINFGSTHSSIGITLTFDYATEEYATDFNVVFYDASNNIITTQTVTGNTQVQYPLYYTVSNYKKIVVNITKWSVGNRRARLTEIDFGIVKIYTDENLISMNLIEDMDLTASQVPSTEFRFIVDNTDRAFNILNPQSFYPALQKQQQVKAELGLEVNGAIQWTPIGDYLLSDWQTDEGAMTATLTASTNLENMFNFTYQNLTNKTQPYTLYTMAQEIFAICGITNYSLDTSLQSITTNGVVKSTDCKTILQMIAIAGMCNIYVTRNNVITLKSTYVSNGGTRLDTVDLDDMYSEAKVSLDKEVKTVVVSYYTDVNTAVDVSVSDSNVTSGELLELKSNTLISNSTTATNVANWIIARKKYRAMFDANFRGNPLYELNDYIGLENTYGDVKNSVIVKNELMYQGFLKGKLQARGVL